MHPNPIFHGTDPVRDLAFLTRRGFGTIAACGPQGPILAHVPFIVSNDGAVIECHLVRSNPLARMALPTAVVLSVMGPDGYISPDWYGIDDQVPTWNYVNIEVDAELSAADPATLTDLLARQSAETEARLAPKPEWTMDKMTEDTRRRFLRMILPFRLTVKAIRSTWKLGQNKVEAARVGAAEALSHSDFGLETSALAEMMRQPPQP